MYREQLLHRKFLELGTTEKKSILLVDDEPNFRASAAFLLTQLGYCINEAGDASEALRLILDCQQKDDQFHLLITDMKLPAMSGMTLLKHVRTAGITFPVLIITGYLDLLVFKELQRMEPLDILIKPFKPDELLERIALLTSVEQTLMT